MLEKITADGTEYEISRSVSNNSYTVTAHIPRNAELIGIHTEHENNFIYNVQHRFFTKYYFNKGKLACAREYRLGKFNTEIDLGLVTDPKTKLIWLLPKLKVLFNHDANIRAKIHEFKSIVHLVGQ